MLWLILSATVAGVALTTAQRELREPAALGRSIRMEGKSMAKAILATGLLCLGVHFVVACLMARVETHRKDKLEFATALTQALERIANMRAGKPGPLPDGHGSDPDGSRFVLMRDAAGPVVRVENLSRDACTGVLGSLSPYAASVVLMRTEEGIARLDGKVLPCPGPDARSRGVFRPAG